MMRFLLRTFGIISIPTMLTGAASLGITFGRMIAH